MDPPIFQSNDQQLRELPHIEVMLSVPLVVTHRICHAINESKFYKLECTYVGKQVDRLTQMLRSTTQYADSTSLYKRPIHLVLTEVTKNLNHALTLVKKCRRHTIILHYIGVVGVAKFQKVFKLLDVSIGDMKWLLNILDAREIYKSNEGIILTIPSIACNDPSLALVWSCIASLYSNSSNLKIEAANELSTLARDSDRNKMIIVEEGGIAPLLKLLKNELSPEIQVAGAIALFNLTNDQNMAMSIFNEYGIPLLVHALKTSTILVQTEVVKVIARMAEHYPFSQTCFAKVNVIETLVNMLSSNVYDRDQQIVLGLYTNCSKALWMLTRGNVANCKRISETRGLFCLAKLIEKDNRPDLQIICLMIVTEVTSTVEDNPEIRRSTFKTNSAGAKAIVDQLLRLINIQSDNHMIKIAAIRAIGHLARTFTARQTWVISSLLKQLCHINPDVATESVIALEKFICLENYLRVEHTKSIVECEGIRPVMKMLRGNERTRYHALVLLCYIALHVGKKNEFEQANILMALEGIGACIAHKYSELRDLVAQAIHHFDM